MAIEFLIYGANKKLRFGKCNVENFLEILADSVFWNVGFIQSYSFPEDYDEVDYALQFSALINLNRLAAELTRGQQMFYVNDLHCSCCSDFYRFKYEYIFTKKVFF